MIANCTKKMAKCHTIFTKNLLKTEKRSLLTNSFQFHHFRPKRHVIAKKKVFSYN